MRWTRAGRPSSSPIGLVDVGQVGDGQPAPDDEFVGEYVDALLEAGRLETPLGQHVLVLARKMTAAFETGSGVAALSRQLEAMFDKAMQGVRRGDAVDELEQRRQAKVAAARGQR